MAVKTWRKRPVDTEMVQWTGENLDEIAAWTGGQFRLVVNPAALLDGFTAEVYDHLHLAWIPLRVGDSVVRGVQGEHYPIAADVLAATYDEVVPLVLPAGHLSLFESPVLSLREVFQPGEEMTPGEGYQYLHESRCGGQIVAVLGYRWGQRDRRYLLRREITPCWGDGPRLSAITGGVDGAGPRGQAVRELAEESGYLVWANALVGLGTCRAGKSADTAYHLFAVDLSGAVWMSPTGDGSALEALGDAVWVEPADLVHVEDPLVSTLVLRLRHQLGEA